jgi:N-acetylglucosamine-6-phosphate deacetylase
MHIHGCGGVGFDALGPSAEDGAERLRTARDFLRRRGVTTFVPTVVCREEQLRSLVAAVGASGLDETTLPGIYIEGPFINPVRRGGIPEDAIKAYDERALSELLALGQGRVKLMTLAPELPGSAELMASLRAAGVLPCLGHSDCSVEALSLADGPVGLTHLFNAMSGFSHRTGGLAMLPFLDPRPFVELNADGVHVEVAALKACARHLDPERLILISDAVVAAGLAHGEYNYCGSKVVSGYNGVRYADSGVLMGSNRLAPDVLRHWLCTTGASVTEAVKALTLTPARALGIDSRRGAIVPGLDSELVVWTGDFEAARVVGDRSARS